MNNKVTLAALRKKRGFSIPQLAAEMRKHEGGEGMNTTNLSAYLTGARACGDVHFRLLCKILRVDPENVYTSRYLAGGRQEPLAA